MASELATLTVAFHIVLRGLNTRTHYGVKMLQSRRDLLNEELRLIVFLDQGVKHSIKAGSFPDQSQ